jgi:diguanylate cyclase (GGDEF)-like protein
MDEVHQRPYTADRNKRPPLCLSAPLSLPAYANGNGNGKEPRRQTGDDRTPRRHVWAMLGAMLVVVGIVSSALAASAVAHAQGASSQRAFLSSSDEIAAIVELALLHEEDLVVDTEAFVLGEPHATEAEFLAWASSERAMTRFPELLGFGEALMVPASQLKAFANRARTESNTGFPPPKSFVVTPPGDRPFYCFSVIGLNRTLQNGLPPGFDLCAGPGGQALLATRASGATNLTPLTVGSITTLSLGVPVYRGGDIPTTVAARRAAFVGWVGMMLVPADVLNPALAGHSHTAVELRYSAGASLVVFQDGQIPAHARSTRVDLKDGWTVATFAKVDTPGLSGDADALVLLIAGIALTLLLGALLYVLGTGRARATVLVGERTAELQFQALHDPLTKLPNRGLILDRVELMLARARRGHHPAVAMFLDLDDFKEVNDTFGHDIGDQLLIAVGARLVAALRESDTVGRLGGDEFILLVEGPSLTAGPEVAAHRILEVLEAPFNLAGCEVPLYVSASIGVAFGDRVSPDELLRDADVALYLAKGSGKKHAVVFAPAMEVARRDSHALAADLRDALHLGQFFLVYQPTIDLQTDACTGVEALLRWRHPGRGIVEPAGFVPMLETTGHIVEVGAWVLEEACRQGAAWHANGHDLTVSVNVSGRQLELERVVTDVRLGLSLSGFDPRMLVLELTETTLMNDVAETLVRLQSLKATGVRLAIDDFGTGYSSLAYLRLFPIDILKIDRSFVSGMDDSLEAAALVHTLVQLGQALGLETIAEGIEDDDQRLRLLHEGVDTGQGFLFSKPLDVAALDRFLDSFVGPGGPGRSLAQAAAGPPAASQQPRPWRKFI